jgi:hypothetical protein
LLLGWKKAGGMPKAGPWIQIMDGQSPKVACVMNRTKGWIELDLPQWLHGSTYLHHQLAAAAELLKRG